MEFNFINDTGETAHIQLGAGDQVERVRAMLEARAGRRRETPGT
jgi:hypothetical protein